MEILKCMCITLKHLRRILRHKFWVAYYCFQLGLYKQGILHDLSKFGWYEFSRSVKFYDDDTSPLNKEKEILGYSRSYLHHRGRNPHHYEYWVTKLDIGGVPVKMPKEYALELVCDYLAAGKVYNGNSFQGEYNWWIKYINSPRAIHPETKDRYGSNYSHYGYLVFKKERNLETGRIESFEIEESKNCYYSTFVFIDDLCDAGGTFLGELKVLKERYPNSKFIIIVCHVVNDKGLVNMCNNFDQVIVSNSHRDINYRPSNENLTVIDVCK